MMETTPIPTLAAEAQAASSRNGEVKNAKDSAGPVGSGKEGEELRNLYRQVLKFYKENEGKSCQLQYHERLKLVAFTQQVIRGKFSQENVPPLGALDVIGKDRRNAWIALGDITQEEAMRKFIEEVSRVMPHLRPFLEAHQKVDELRREEIEQARLAREEQSQRQIASQEAERLAEAEGQRQEEQRRQIQDALNMQTFPQFKAYAVSQFPSNPDQQAVLIRQLQEQHYYQYMQQIYQQQMESHAKDTLLSHGAAADAVADGIANLDVRQEGARNEEEHEKEEEDEDEEEDDEEAEEEEEEEDISPASMWTKKEISEFKVSLRSEGGDSIIKVGHGETVTVRVPTHDEGSAIFWEFATDAYDLAFGLFFEWCKTDEETEVSVHVSDSEDEDIDEKEDGDSADDPEGGSAARAALVDKCPPTSVIVPIYRRDCHQEVYAGTHQYPGPGVYLLKFDNTYSLWRAKTLYYRVYYTK